MPTAKRPTVCIDCRYIRERPSGIATIVQALVDHLPAMAPDLDFFFLKHPNAPARLSARGARRQAPSGYPEPLKLLATDPSEFRDHVHVPIIHHVAHLLRAARRSHGEVDDELQRPVGTVSLARALA